jgi:hypothetical protein
MVDSGATDNFMAPEAAASAKLRTLKKQVPYKLHLADGQLANGDGVVKYETQEFEMQLGQHSERIKMDLVPLGGHQIILGMPWLRNHNPHIDWVTRTVQCDECKCKKEFARGLARPTPGQELKATRSPRSDTFAQDPSLKHIPAEYMEYAEIFRERPKEQALPKHQAWDHEIKLKEGTEPPRLKMIPLSEEKLGLLREYLDEMLSKGFIRESSSAAGAPIFFVPKKGDEKGRPVVDYRKLNDITIKDAYPLPLASELRDRIQGAKYFTKLDQRSGFNLIRIVESDVWKTAFITRYGLYEYLVMPFGLCNAPATCMRLVHKLLRKYLDKYCVAYLDDILIFTKTLEEHVKIVREILQILMDAGILLKPSKCEFHVTETEFLGYIVSTTGLKMSPHKVKEVLEWKEPTTIKGMQSFLGFANFYRRFIKDYSKIAAPLMELTKKDVTYKWNDAARKAFETLKQAFTRAPVLITFDPDQPITVETDASDYALGAVLSQPGKDGKLQPVAYYSKKLQPAELNYEIYDKELLAIVCAFKEWEVYLMGSKQTVTVYSDHKNLVYFMTTKILNRRQVRWAEMLAMYNFKILYVKGTENARADALSRKEEYQEEGKSESHAIFRQEGDSLVFNSAQLATMTKIRDDHLEKQVQQHYENDSTAKRVLERPGEGFTIREKVIYFHEKIYIPSTLAKQFTQEQHELPAHGHQGITKTFARIKANSYFPRMRKIVEEVIGNCDTCIRNKTSRHAPYGQLKTPDTPTQPWKSIAWDFVVKLPPSKDPITGVVYDSILVIVDRLTKFGYMIPYKESSTAEDLAYIFLRIVASVHGVPTEIISDRDKLFTSKFWQTLTALLGIKRKLSTAFHPQTDGQTERLNQTMEQYLRCYINYRQDNWVELLPLAQFAYNTAEAATTNMTPAYANFGFEPKAYNTQLPDLAKSDIAITKAEDLRNLHEQLSLDIKFIAQRTAYYYNTKRSMEPTLKKGDKVYLLRRNINTKRPSDKLDHKKLGPFKISEVVGPVNYRLELPQTMNIHPVFHISLLEPAPPGAPNAPYTEIEPVNPNAEYEVEEILDQKYIRGKLHYLIKWEGYPHSENTWEPITNLNCPADLEKFHRRNPQLPTRQPSQNHSSEATRRKTNRPRRK